MVPRPLRQTFFLLGLAVLCLFASAWLDRGAEAARPARTAGESTPPAELTLGTPPLFFRSTSGTTWVTVGTSGCSAADTTYSNHGQTEVWCFDGSGGDSTWPARGTQGFGNWNHWPKFNPPVPSPSKWHVNTRGVGASGGTYAAWCGCDSLETNPACNDVAFWAFQEGYGDDWNYSLELDMSGQNASAGGTIEFDLMYDCEINYDYMYLEYRNSTTGLWQVVNNPSPARFSGSTAWQTNLVYTMPAQSGGMRLRWRGTADGATSDQDGYLDTDGIGRIDNVTVTFTASGSVVSDSFESGNFNGVSATTGSATWIPQNLQGNTYDGWHLQLDPAYKNKGNTCEFSNDWMWAAKPTVGPIPVNGFDYLLVSPSIHVTGWDAGVIEYSTYHCTPEDRSGDVARVFRRFDSAIGAWSPWTFPDTFPIWDLGCDSWHMDETEDLTPFLGATTDSIQIAWRMADYSQPGDLRWGAHVGVNYLIDNVSIGHYDASSTAISARPIDLLSDTFSRVDPAHTSFLANGEEGNWSGNGGTRAFADVDSLSLNIRDPDGITAANVRLHYRVGTGTPPTFGSWSDKAMVLSDPWPSTSTDEGTYRGTVGNTTTEDFSAAEGIPDPIFDAGSTIEYYVRVTDDASDVVTFPATADDMPTPIFLRFHVLPFNRVASDSSRILLVDDVDRLTLDFENSVGFDPLGGRGFGGFTSPTFDEPEDIVERALAKMYGGSEDVTGGVYGAPRWDIYNVQGAYSSIQREPRIVSNVTQGLGGICDDAGIPNYDAVIWLLGTFDAYSYADTTRIELKTFLDNGGKMFSSGDEVAYFLGAPGQDADSVVQFLGPYFGTAFTSAADDETLDRSLNIQGVNGTSLQGLTIALYGDCPSSRSFDKLTLAPASPTEYLNTVLATYEGASPNTDGTNGRPSMIKNVRVAGGGVAVHCGFGVEALTSTCAIAAVLSRVFETDFGLPSTSPCLVGTDAPVVRMPSFGFDLAQATPNPFRDATAIRFAVSRRSHVSIAIYNILGQKVRQLVDETLESNTYVREWDGLGPTGDPVSSGIYFARMTAADYTGTRRIVRLR